MDNPIAIDPLEDFSEGASLDTTQDIENLLGIFSAEPINVTKDGHEGSKSEEVLLSESGEGITLYGASSSENVEIVNASQGQVEISLNSSGYVSSGSPLDSTINSRIGTVRPPSADQYYSSSSGDSSVSVDNGISVIQEVHPPPLVIQNGGPDVQQQTSDYDTNLYNSPGWFRGLYPELHSAWLANSGSQFYQGGVRMLCSRCKTQDAAGFHEGLPLCEACRVGAACTVCRIRVASVFSHGLAICEADRVFLHRILTNKTNFKKCRVLCPVTVQKWCGYCRLRTCISAKGFRFSVSASTGHLSSQQPLHKLRKYSGKGNYKELNFHTDLVNPDTIYLSPPEGQSSNDVNTTYQQSTSHQANQAYVTQSNAHPQAFQPYPTYSVRTHDTNQEATARVQQVTSQPKVYDGSGLGLSNRKESGSFGLNNDPKRSEWVLEQQEKYLQHHLAIYRSRMKIRRI